MPIINSFIGHKEATTQNTLSWYRTGNPVLQYCTITVNGDTVHNGGYGDIIPATSTEIGSYSSGSTVVIQLKTDVLDDLSAVNLYLNGTLYGSATEGSKDTHILNQTFTLNENTTMLIEFV